MKQKGFEKRTLVLAIIYLVTLVWIVLFKTVEPWRIGELDRMRRINLIPFNYDTEAPFHLSEVLLNVAVFVPFGVLLSMLGVRPALTVTLGAGFSLLMETLQYAFRVGASDVTDLITNTAGTALGVGAYLLLSRIVKDRAKLRRAVVIVGFACAGVFFAFAAVLFLANR
ncbi:MAG: VanZ family protein [Clostridia bacterium]|nr:VanZ family protein [Clostridia bacterium]